MDLEEYKSKLKNEIGTAEANLIHNMSRANMSDYLMGSGKSVLSNIPIAFMADPLKSIDTINSISRQLLKPTHIINRVLSKVGFVNTIIKNLIK